eukprot:m.20708 g.20708  ORF g.20708 m.20708 type:complete len:244 (+) comp28066_c0_seq2:2-733(+)
MTASKCVCRVQFDEKAYVLHLDMSKETSESHSVAASGSSDVIKIFSCHNLQIKGTLQDSDLTSISGIQFHPENPHLLFSSSLNGCVQCWDLRTSTVGRMYRLRFQRDKEFCSFDVNCTGRTVAAGTDASSDDNDAFVIFWDTRLSMPLKVFEDVHSDDVTQVKFHPTNRHQLVTGSTDGLVCLLDLSEANEDDSLITVFNSESSVVSLAILPVINFNLGTHLNLESDRLFWCRLGLHLLSYKQ